MLRLKPTQIEFGKRDLDWHLARHEQRQKNRQGIEPTDSTSRGTSRPSRKQSSRSRKQTIKLPRGESTVYEPSTDALISKTPPPHDSKKFWNKILAEAGIPARRGLETNIHDYQNAEENVNDVSENEATTTILSSYLNGRSTSSLTRKSHSSASNSQDSIPRPALARFMTFLHRRPHAGHEAHGFDGNDEMKAYVKEDVLKAESSTALPLDAPTYVLPLRRGQILTDWEPLHHHTSPVRNELYTPPRLPPPFSATARSFVPSRSTSVTASLPATPVRSAPSTPDVPARALLTPSPHDTPSPGPLDYENFEIFPETSFAVYDDRRPSASQPQTPADIRGPPHALTRPYLNTAPQMRGSARMTTVLPPSAVETGVGGARQVEQIAAWRNYATPTRRSRRGREMVMGDRENVGALTTEERVWRRMWNDEVNNGGGGRGPA